MASLVDTNILVYRFDPRDPLKQQIAHDVLRRGLASRELVLPHQAIVEFVAAVRRPQSDLDGAPILGDEAAFHEARTFMLHYPILYPDVEVLAIALKSAPAFGLSWYYAHLLAYAEVNGVPEILSEDFQHGRHYGSVRVVDPFLAAAGGVHELPPMYDEAEA